MRALKAVVLALGTLCLGAFGVLVYLVVAGMGNPVGQPAAADAMALDLPPDAQVVSIAAAGELLAIHVRVPGEPDRVVVIDPRTGAIRLNVSPRTP